MYDNSGGGHCFVYALKDQLRRLNDARHSTSVEDFRKAAIAYLRENPGAISQEQWAFAMFEHNDEALADPDVYLNQLLGELWFDAISITALARSMNFRIVLTSSLSGTQTVYGENDAAITVYMLYTGHHYMSLHPSGCGCDNCSRG